MVLYILHCLHYIQSITDKELNLAVHILRLQTSKQQFQGDYFHTDTGWFVGTESVNMFLGQRENVSALTRLLAAHVAFLLHVVSWTVTLLQAVLHTHRLSTDLPQNKTKYFYDHACKRKSGECGKQLKKDGENK